MARIPRFEVKNTQKGWKVEVPDSYSETGQRQQRFFPTREKANEFAKGLKEKAKEFGTQSRNMGAGDTEDAVQALEILRGFDITLAQCARDYVSRHDKRSQAPTLAQAWVASTKRRENYSKAYLTNLAKLGRKLPSDLMKTNIVDLTGEKIEVALSAICGGQTYFVSACRYLSAILGDYEKSGTIHENPCKRVNLPRLRPTDEVRIYTIPEIQALFAACRDYPDGLDRQCKACAVPFAFLAFAGIRPNELTRLRWEDVSLEETNIRIGGGIAKMRRTRNIRLNPTLQAWIETVPKDERIGKIVPSRWTQRAGRVKREAGLDGKDLQDALRHSYGSYKFATDHDDSALRRDMGHGSKDTFFTFYHKAVTEAQAIPYWELKPI